MSLLSKNLFSTISCTEMRILTMITVLLFRFTHSLIGGACSCKVKNDMFCTQ